jgi:4'-phosphopantetheinyl transferase
MTMITRFICDWHHPPGVLTLERGQLDIWLLKLDDAPCQPGCLDADETTRLKNFKFPLGRQQYCSAHTALRIILGRYLNCAAGEVPIAIHSAGKPRIDHQPPSLYFNLSHAENTALLAIRPEYEVGIDIENIRDTPNIDRLAQRTMRVHEVARLEQSGWDTKLFFELWTRMEARQKCLGRGVFGEAVGEDLVETRTMMLKVDQCAAIAWPVGTEPDFVNFFHDGIPPL